jgi:hypothetical protein
MERLATDEEREHFIEQFLNATPDTAENYQGEIASLRQ